MVTLSPSEVNNFLVEALLGVTLDETSRQQFMVTSDTRMKDWSRLILKLPIESLLSESNRQPNFTLQLELKDVDLILEHVIRRFIKQQSVSALKWLGAAYGRCFDDHVSSSSSLLVSNAWKLYSEQDNALTLETLRETIVRYAVLLLRYPSYFADAIHVPGGQYLFHLVVPIHGSHSARFLVDLFNGLKDSSSASHPNEDDELKHLMNETLDEFHSQLSKRSLLETKCVEVNGLAHLFNIKSFASLCPSDIQFKPPSVPEKSLGWFLPKSFLIGPLLLLTPLDEFQFKQDLSSSTRHRHFKNYFVIHKKLNAVNDIQQCLSANMDLAASVATAWCKTFLRDVLFSWIDTVCSSNSSKARYFYFQAIAHLESDASPFSESFYLEGLGLSPNGFLLNVLWLILKLAEPISLSKCDGLDPFLMLRDSAKAFLGQFTEEACFGDVEELEQVHAFLKEHPDTDKYLKFPSQIFFVAIRALHVLLLPVLIELEEIEKKFDNLLKNDFIINGLIPQPSNSDIQQRMDYFAGKLVCYKIVLLNPQFTSLVWKFINLTITYLSQLFLIYGDNGLCSETKLASLKKDGLEGIHEALHQDGPAVGSESSPPYQFLALPACIIEDILAAARWYFLQMARLHERKLLLDPMFANSLTGCNVKALASFCLFLLKSNHLIRNPHMRYNSVFTTFVAMYSLKPFETQLNVDPVVTRWLIPSLVNAFIAAQKAGYYWRIVERLSYTQFFGIILPLTQFSQCLQAFASEKPETFVRFVSILVESLTWFLDEAMSALTEIKQREIKSQQQPPSSTTSEEPLVSRDRHLDTSQAEGGSAQTSAEEHDVTQMPFDELERLCQNLMSGGIKSIKVVATVVKLCGGMIVGSHILINQVVTSLDCSLHHLVGPRCLRLKVSNFQKYGFDPRLLLATICEIYITLNAIEPETLTKAICNDTLFFDPHIFVKAHNIARKEALLEHSLLRAFSDLVQSLQLKKTQVDFEEQWLMKIWDSIPDHYKDPIMDEIMVDPVILPSSGTVIDRQHIERHLMTEEFDPFNRAPLKKTDLIPHPELQKEIKAYMEEQRAKMLAEFQPSDPNSAS